MSTGLNRVPHFGEFRVVKRAAVAVFRRARLETNHTGGAVDLVPLEREDFRGHAPAGVVGKGHRMVKRWRQMASHGVELLALEKPLADVVLFQQRDVGPLENASRLHRHGEQRDLRCP